MPYKVADASENNSSTILSSLDIIELIQLHLVASHYQTLDFQFSMKAFSFFLIGITNTLYW